MIEQPLMVTKADIAQDENYEGLPPRICEFLTNASEALPILRQRRVGLEDSPFSAAVLSTEGIPNRPEGIVRAAYISYISTNST